MSASEHVQLMPFSYHLHLYVDILVLIASSYLTLSSPCFMASSCTHILLQLNDVVDSAKSHLPLLYKRLCYVKDRRPPLSSFTYVDQEYCYLSNSFDILIHRLQRNVGHQQLSLLSLSLCLACKRQLSKKKTDEATSTP